MSQETETPLPAEPQACSPLLLEQNSGLVDRLARQLRSRLPPSVDVDDLIQAGMIGLTDALLRFDANHGAKFEVYAAHRITGSMLDELRRMDHVSRDLREQRRSFRVAMQRLEQVLGRAPTDGETARELDLTLAEYQSAVGRIDAAGVVYIEDLVERSGSKALDRHMADEAGDPQLRLQHQRMREALISEIGILPQRQQQIMSMYYEHDVSFKTIARVLELTQSRVSQLHAQALSRLRTKLSDH